MPTLSAALAALPTSTALDSVVGLEGSTAKQGDSLPYLKYIALLSQGGTDAPVATVLENTLGGTVVWTYDAVGSYIGTLAGAFTANKTALMVGNAINGGNYYGRDNSNDVFLVTFDSSFTESDGQLSETMIEIRVYP